MNFDFSNTTLIIVLAVALLVIVIGVAAFLQHRKSTTIAMRQRFGSEYDRAVLEHGSERKAEAKLADRESRVEKLKIKELPKAQRDRFIADWCAVQARFVDHPKGSVTEADELVSSLLQARGYPISDFEQSAEDISVNYPGVMEHYRSAHSIAVRPGRAEASTEELRTAMIDYRTLFDELVQVETLATQGIAP